MGQRDEFRVGEKVTMVIRGIENQSSGSRIVRIEEIVGEGVYQVTGGGLVHVKDIYESGEFEPIFEEV